MNGGQKHQEKTIQHVEQYHKMQKRRQDVEKNKKDKGEEENCCSIFRKNSSIFALSIFLDNNSFSEQNYDNY